ncbi:MAG: hypothetical protein WAO20_05820 [Acidobacteriota bacterium]
MSILPDDVRRKIPGIGSDLEAPLREMSIYARLYDPSSHWQWFILEMDGDDACFGIVLSRSAAVAGRFTLTELLSLSGPGGEAAVVFDAAYAGQTVGRLAEAEPAVAELLAVPSPREKRSAEELIDLE